MIQIFEDKASGTATKKRPQLQALMKAASQRQIDIVLVWKLDRFARSLKDLVTMLSQLQELGVEFISLKDSIDLTTSQGRLLAQLIGAFAEFEASLIRERVKAGLKNAKANGVKLGKPQQIDTQLVAKLRADGLSYRQIAKRLGYTSTGIFNAMKRTSHSVKR